MYTRICTIDSDMAAGVDMDIHVDMEWRCERHAFGGQDRAGPGAGPSSRGLYSCMRAWP